MIRITVVRSKNINLGLGLMALLALSSCADDKFSEYRTDMTKNLKEYQYLNNYEPLKKYVEDMKAAGKHPSRQYDIYYCLLHLIMLNTFLNILEYNKQ